MWYVPNYKVFVIRSFQGNNEPGIKHTLLMRKIKFGVVLLNSVILEGNK